MAAAGAPSRHDFYSKLLSQAKPLLASTTEPIACMANIAALIYHSLQKNYGPEAVNWCGFYILREVSYRQTEPHDEHAEDTQSTLVLGPFHGQPAVALIRQGHGVCGTAVVQRRTQLVPDVHKHPNHIACDPKSQSEIVVPVWWAGSDGQPQLVAVLDIDCPTVNGFSEEDVAGLEQLTALLGSSVLWVSHPVVLEKRSDLTEMDDTCVSTKVH